MEYKFVSEERGSTLEETVNNLIADGWKPLGGVSVCSIPCAIEHETEWIYAQAMTRCDGA